MNTILFWLIRQVAYHVGRLILLGFISRKIGEYLFSLIGLQPVKVARAGRRQSNPYHYSEN